MPCLSSAAGPPPKGAAPCAKGFEVNAPVVTGAPVPKAAGADAPNDGGSGGCAPANSEITHPRPEVPSVPDVAGGDNPQPGDSTPSLSTDASMGMASHPETSKPVGQDVQPEPADAGGAKRASPSQGTAGGDNDGDGDGAEGDSPTSPADELPGRDDPMDGSGTGGGGGPNPPDGDDDPSEPGDHESGPDSEYYASAESADACIAVHYLFRRAGYPPALAAWRNGAWPRRLLYPIQANSIEDALALPLWQGLSEDEFFQLLDNASATDRRFGEYDWDFLSKAIMSDTMNADDIHHAGAKALADWAEENLGPLSIGPRSDLVARFNQMQTERGHPNRESANESSVGPGKQYVPRPPLEDQPNSNQISADVFRGREVRLGLTLPDSQSGEDELSAQDATWSVEYCDFYKAAANLWRARSCLREAAGCIIETGYIHPQMAAAIAATEKVERFCNVLRAANRYAGLGTYDSMTSWAGICSMDTTAGELLRGRMTIPSSLLGKLRTFSVPIARAF